MKIWPDIGRSISQKRQQIRISQDAPVRIGQKPRLIKEPPQEKKSRCLRITNLDPLNHQPESTHGNDLGPLHICNSHIAWSSMWDP